MSARPASRWSSSLKRWWTLPRHRVVRHTCDMSVRSCRGPHAATGWRAHSVPCASVSYILGAEDARARMRVSSEGTKPPQVDRVWGWKPEAPHAKELESTYEGGGNVHVPPTVMSPQRRAAIHCHGRTVRTTSSGYPKRRARVSEVLREQARTHENQRAGRREELTCAR